MSVDLRTVFAVAGATTVIVLLLVVVDVLEVGMAAAWAGDTGTVGGAITVLMLVVVAAALLLRD